MNRTLIAVLSLTSLALFAPGCTEKSGAPAAGAEAATAAQEHCEHGVSPSICTRCNPKLEPVFRSRGDWCPEHARAESQCTICNPELAEKGIK